MTTHLTAVDNFLRHFQHTFCTRMAALDGQKSFREDRWKKEPHESLQGEGISCVLEGGATFEKAGANFSFVHGQHMPKAATAHRPELAGSAFSALGVSIVMHPLNPFAPTSHANVRYFEARRPDGSAQWWFGGGFDLTPYYGFEEDCVLWHQHAKTACDTFDPTAYERFKTWADDYFYLPHRQEPRGIGGIFYDDLNEQNFDACFGFMQAVAMHYLEAYEAVVQKRKDHSYTEKEVEFQRIRRGRYVEFNLLYDRGTLFGLQSGGRTESILMSLPATVEWHYDWKPQPGSAEARLTEVFLKPRKWASSSL